MTSTADSLFIATSSHAVRGGDLVVTKMGDPPGMPANYPTERSGGIITSDCLKWSLASHLVDVRFAYHGVASDLVHGRIVETTKGGAHHKISLKRFRNIFFPLPPLAEQHRIVAKVEDLMALCDLREVALTTTDTTRARLLEALQYEDLNPTATPATEAAERVRRLSGSVPMEELVDMFRALDSPTTRLGAVFVTASGKSTEKLQRLITSWDVLGGATQ